MNSTMTRLSGAFAALALLAAACGSEAPDALGAEGSNLPIEETTETSVVEATDVAEADPEPDHDHGALDPIETDLDLAVTVVAAEVVGDAVTITIETSDGFSFVDDDTGTANGHVDGEGHVHLYVDGEKITRVYAPTYTHSGLAPGVHTVRVELSTNEHHPYSIGGLPVDDQVSIEVVGESENVIGLTIADGVTTDGVREWEVPLGSTVSIRIDADAAHEVHVHGYDVFLDTTPGGTAELNLVADIPGQFEVEIESTGQLIAELVVS